MTISDNISPPPATRARPRARRDEQGKCVECGRRRLANNEYSIKVDGARRATVNTIGDYLGHGFIRTISLAAALGIDLYHRIATSGQPPDQTIERLRAIADGAQETP